MQRRANLFVPALGCMVAFAALGLSACVESEAGAGTEPPSATSQPTEATLPPATLPPVTEAPTSLATTTVAVTQPPTTVPLPTIPSNAQDIGVAAVAIPAVGTSSGENTKIVQDRLLQLGFWHGGSDGQYGLTTRQAVMAFQKYMGIEATGSVDQATAGYMGAWPEKARGLADTGTLVEIDKTRQLLFFVVDGITVWTLNTSTGNGEEYTEPDQNTPGEMITGVSLTPDGIWKVNRERQEGWWEGDLGEIYRPKYFRGGVAVHGSNSIPNYPASHGCVRVSVPAMDYIWETNLMPMGTTVWVHGG